jgi:hypothetical protein
MQNAQLALVHYNITRLLELGAAEEFVRDLSDKESMELLKGIIYLREKNKRED